MFKIFPRKLSSAVKASRNSHIKGEGANELKGWDLFILSLMPTILIGTWHMKHGKNRFLPRICFLLIPVIYFAIGPNGMNPTKSTDRTKASEGRKHRKWLQTSIFLPSMCECNLQTSITPDTKL